jgi:hypothetical protein
MNLLTTNEILRINPVYRNTDMANYCSSITSVEIDCFNTCFGLDFRKKMIDDRIIYEKLEDFQEGIDYQEGDAVIHMNTIYVSKENNNYFNLSSEKWEISKYFQDDKYNGLWESGLGLYLSTKVIIQAYPHIAYQIEGKGVGKIFEDSGFRTVEKPEYYMLLKSMEHTANLALKAAKIYYNINFVSIKNDCLTKDNCNEDDDRIAW